MLGVYNPFTSGIIGLLIWGFGMVLLARVERIKKEHDLVTYHEILAYSKGEPVDRSNPRSQRARRHPVLRGVILTLVSAIVGALAGYFVYKFGIFG